MSLLASGDFDVDPGVPIRFQVQVNPGDGVLRDLPSLTAQQGSDDGNCVAAVFQERLESRQRLPRGDPDRPAQFLVVKRLDVRSQVCESGRKLAVEFQGNKGMRDGPGDEAEVSRPWRHRRPGTPVLGRAPLEQIADFLAGLRADVDADRGFQFRPEIRARSAVPVPDLGCCHDQGERIHSPPIALKGIASCCTADRLAHVLRVYFGKAVLDEEDRSGSAVAQSGELLRQEPLGVNYALRFLHLGCSGLDEGGGRFPTSIDIVHG